MPTRKRWRQLEAGPDRPTSPPSESSPDAMASPQHSSSSDGSTSSGYPAPHLSSDESISGYSWLLDRPPRLSPNLPASLHESASLSPSGSSSGSSEISSPAVSQGLAPDVLRVPLGIRWHLYLLAREMGPFPPALFQVFALPEHLSSSSSVSSEIPSSPQLTTGSESSDRATPETYSPSDQFTSSHFPSSLSSADSFSRINPWFSDESMPSTPYSSASVGSLSVSDGPVPSHDSISGGSVPSHHLSSLSPADPFMWRDPWISSDSISTPYSSASGGSLSSHYLSASDGPVPSHDSMSVPSHDSMSVPSHLSMPEEFAPSLTPDGSPPSPSSPPTETPPYNAKFFNENMMRKLKIAAGVTIVGGVIAGIVGSQIKHRDCEGS